MAKIEQILEKYGSDPARSGDTAGRKKRKVTFLRTAYAPLREAVLPLSKLYHMATFTKP